jgi:hypothetical protein
MPTTPLLGFGAYTHSARVEDTVADYLGEFAGDYDFEGLVAAYRDAINIQLDSTGISLHGDDFYSNYPAPGNSTELIEAALENVDLGGLAEQYDRS